MKARALGIPAPPQPGGASRKIHSYKSHAFKLKPRAIPAPKPKKVPHVKPDHAKILRQRVDEIRARNREVRMAGIEEAAQRALKDQVKRA
ncbi:hypothetical protein P7C70_g851, partial [Phenoliferia sp. Uapishka_3]